MDRERDRWLCIHIYTFFVISTHAYIHFDVCIIVPLKKKFGVHIYVCVYVYAMVRMPGENGGVQYKLRKDKGYVFLSL